MRCTYKYNADTEIYSFWIADACVFELDGVSPVQVQELTDNLVSMTAFCVNRTANDYQHKLGSCNAGVNHELQLDPEFIEVVEDSNHG